MDTRSPVPGTPQDRAATKDVLATFNKLEDLCHEDIRQRRRRANVFLTACLVANLLAAVMIALLVWGMNS